MKPTLLNFFIVSLIMGLTSCLSTEKKTTDTSEVKTTDMDIHSFARPSEAVIKHLSLDLKADFNLKTLSGTATYDIDVMANADSIYLDTRDLDIHQVSVNNEKVEFKLGAAKGIMGQPLVVPVTEQSKKLVITYSTRPGAEALQWLTPSQTAGKKHPYLFTQGQAILTRTW